MTVPTPADLARSFRTAIPAAREREIVALIGSYDAELDRVQERKRAVFAKLRRELADRGFDKTEVAVAIGLLKARIAATRQRPPAPRQVARAKAQKPASEPSIASRNAPRAALSASRATRVRA